jgi:hypothetical protein
MTGSSANLSCPHHHPFVRSLNKPPLWTRLSTQDDICSACDAAFECARLVSDVLPGGSPEWIEAEQYPKLHIECSDLDRDEIAVISPFFNPASEGATPFPNPDDEETRLLLEGYAKFREWIK